MSEALTDKMSVPAVRGSQQESARSGGEARAGIGAILPRINSPADLKRLDQNELEKVASVLRQYVVEAVSKTGGHLAPSLWAGELTITLHYFFEAPRVKIACDVEHQA